MTSSIRRPMNSRSAAGCCCRERERSGAASSSAMAMAAVTSRISTFRSKRRRCCFPVFAGCRAAAVRRFPAIPHGTCCTISTSRNAISWAAASRISGWRVSVLTRLYPELDGRIGYSGISFGGGIGALAIPFDKRIDRGHLVVPTFGNMPLWLTLPTIGSGHSVQNYQKTHGDVLETLRLFDAATAATRIADTHARCRRPLRSGGGAALPVFGRQCAADIKPS